MANEVKAKQMKTMVITGASSGLGLAIAELIKRWHLGWNLINWSRYDECVDDDNSVDVRDRKSVRAAAERITGNVHVLINCAGINVINKLENVTEEEYDLVMDTNAKGIFNCTQALLDKLVGGTVINIVSNAAHVPMSHSLAYNASKAAAWQMTRQLARELMPSHGITVFSISPNKLNGTGMSADIEKQVCKIRGWTPEEAAAYQRKALLTGSETSVDDLAEFIVWLISSKNRHRWFAGCDIPYGL